jgi:hypothetical protein
MMRRRRKAWFKLYTDILDDSRVQGLRANVFKFWINCLCVAHKEGGYLPSLESVAYCVRCSRADTERWLKELIDLGLFVVEGGRLRPEAKELRPPMHIWKMIRERIFKRDDYTCQYCGVRGGKLQCDHYIPVSKGGTHDDENLKTACEPCNRRKAARMPEDFVCAG